MRIALLEDDSAQAELLQAWLKAAGHQYSHWSTGQSFIKAIRRDSFDLLIIDWGLPDLSGEDVLNWVRDNMDWPIPVLFATSRDSEEDIVRALEAGADDYMVKPINRSELLARVHALGRRSQIQDPKDKIIDFGTFTIDTTQHEISRSGQVVELTQKEYELALFLFRNVGRLISRGHLLECVWGQTADLNTRTVDTHASRIRQKLGLGAASGWRLKTVYQHGYRLEQTGDQQQS